MVQCIMHNETDTSNVQFEFELINYVFSMKQSPSIRISNADVSTVK